MVRASARSTLGDERRQDNDRLTHCTPFNTECSQDILRPADYPMRRTFDLFTTFDLRSIWTVKDKQWKKGVMHELHALEQDRPQLRVLTLIHTVFIVADPVGSMNDPYRRVNPDPEPAYAVGVRKKPIFESDSCQRPFFRRCLQCLHGGKKISEL